MILLYTATNSAGSKNAKCYFQKKHIPYREIKINYKLSRAEIIRMLRLSTKGFEDILSPRSDVYRANKDYINDMSFSQMIDFIINNPTILKKPIIIDGDHMSVGYSAEDITSYK